MAHLASALLISACVSAAAVGLPTAALAWGAEGHRIACEIAWHRLSPKARNWLRDRRARDRSGDKTFAESCVWADRVKRSQPHTYAYHFINVPAGVGGVDLRRDCPVDKRCAPWAIEHYLGILSDRRAGVSARAEALKFVGHFVADLHQPLHVGRLEDRGGNDIPVDFEGDYGRCPRRDDPRPRGALSLHALWDDTLVRRGKLKWRRDGQRLAATITKNQAAAWGRGDILAWTDDTYRLSEKLAYDLPDEVEHCGGRRYKQISKRYTARAVAAVEEQLQKSGLRLAIVLEAAAARSEAGSNSPGGSPGRDVVGGTGQ